MVGLMIASLLAVGVVAVAGDGFGNGASNSALGQTATGDCALASAGQDADGDGIVNSEDTDWVRLLDGSGYGHGQGYGQNLSGDRPLDGAGYGARQGSGQGQSGCSGTCDGSCL